MRPPDVRDPSEAGSGAKRTRITAVVLVVLAVTILVGCLGPPEERELMIDLTVEQDMVAQGDSAILHVKAEGPSLVEIEVDYGDGVVDTDQTFGAVEVNRRLAHLYEAAATYQAVARVTTADSVVVSDQATVEVVP